MNKLSSRLVVIFFLLFTAIALVARFVPLHCCASKNRRKNIKKRKARANLISPGFCLCAALIFPEALVPFLDHFRSAWYRVGIIAISVWCNLWLGIPGEAIGEETNFRLQCFIPLDHLPRISGIASKK